MSDTLPSIRFLALLPFIYEWEGVEYENDPDDPGGETKFGIDKRSHPNEDIKHLTEERAAEIYWQEWLDDGCEKMPSPYAEVFFNCAVNMGLARAKEFDAQVPGADADHFLRLQEAHYRRLGEQPKRAKYLKGWLNRTAALRSRISRIA